MRPPRTLGVVVAVIVAGSGPIGQRGVPPAPPSANSRPETVLALRASSDVIVRVRVSAGGAVLADTVAAATIAVDGQPVQELLLFPGSGRSEYEALVGPLAAGTRRIGAAPSPLWPAAGAVRVLGIDARPVAADDPDRDVFRFAPAIGLRADTIGLATDLPLHMYCEREKDLLRYSLIFTNEDGGTASRALMARWGRAVDIELGYEVAVRNGEPERVTFQGPDHHMLPYADLGRRPLWLLVATLNNVFLDRGRSAANVRLVPEIVDLRNATRESVIDRHPWIFRVTAGELAREGKLQVIDEPRRYAYLEAKLTLTRAAAAARIGLRDGTWIASHGGRADLTITRDGWVRTSIPLGAAEGSAITAAGWECVPVPAETRPGTCEIEATRAFVLDTNYAPGPNLMAATTMTLRAGEMKSVPAMRP